MNICNSGSAVKALKSKDKKRFKKDQTAWISIFWYANQWEEQVNGK